MGKQSGKDSFLKETLPRRKQQVQAKIESHQNSHVQLESKLGELLWKKLFGPTPAKIERMHACDPEKALWVHSQEKCIPMLATGFVPNCSKYYNLQGTKLETIPTPVNSGMNELHVESHCDLALSHENERPAITRYNTDKSHTRSTEGRSQAGKSIDSKTLFTKSANTGKTNVSSQTSEELFDGHRGLGQHLEGSTGGLCRAGHALLLDLGAGYSNA